MFDITAPIERQFTRDGRKVLAIFDSGIDCADPIAYWTERHSHAICLRKDGHTYSCGTSDSDIITRPEQLPLIVGYSNIYGTNNLGGKVHGSEYDAEIFRERHCSATIKIIFDPNTGLSSAETVWKKEMK